MSSGTPTRSSGANTRVSPTIPPKTPPVASPQKTLTGLPRVVSDLVAEFYNSIQKWNGLLIKGMPIIKQIINFKRNNPSGLTPPLERATIQLCNFVEELEQVLANLNELNNKMENAVKLQKDDKPLFRSLSAETFSKHFKDILEAYKEEFKLKQSVSESIALMEDINQVIALGALWEYQTKIQKTIKLKMQMLLSETGLKQLN